MLCPLHFPATLSPLHFLSQTFKSEICSCRGEVETKFSMNFRRQVPKDLEICNPGSTGQKLKHKVKSFAGRDKMIIPTLRLSYLEIPYPREFHKRSFCLWMVCCRVRQKNGAWSFLRTMENEREKRKVLRNRSLKVQCLKVVLKPKSKWF